MQGSSIQNLICFGMLEVLRWGRFGWQRGGKLELFLSPIDISVVFCLSSFSRCAVAILHGVNALTRREMAVAV